MGYCVNHSDRETSYGCMKHNIYMCEECLDCRDPEIYCKFRSSCPIHFLTKRKGNLDGDSENQRPPAEVAPAPSKGHPHTPISAGGR